MTHAPQDIVTKAAEVRQCFAEAVAALADPEALELVARFALDWPEIEFEPVALTAAVINAKLELDRRRGVPAPALPGATVLPLPLSSAAAAGAVLLPLPRGFV